MVNELLTFKCEVCGTRIKAYFGKGALTFLVLDKLYSREDILIHLGYVMCPICREMNNNMKFEKVFP